MSVKNETNDVLLEVGCAEVPAGFLPDTLDQLVSLAESELSAVGLTYSEVQSWATPRRLILYISGVPQETMGKTEEIRGPSEEISFDENGEPTRAAEGFAASQGVALDDLQIRQEKRGRYVWAVLTSPGREAVSALRDAMQNILKSLSFPQTMRWGEGDIEFVRPLRWIVALYGTDIIPVEFAGKKAQRQTRGPRFSPENIDVENASEYIDKMREMQLIVRPQKRRERIVQQCGELAVSVNGSPVIPESLLQEVTFLVESPQVALGSIPSDFLEVPRVVITTAMQTHLRFFPVEDSDGQLKPYFLSVINGNDAMCDTVVPGNELVLHARLADARFFWEEDTEISLQEHAERLPEVIVHEEMGSLADKAERLSQVLCQLTADGVIRSGLQDTLLRAAQLCKADRVTLMVREFPALQGRMGEEYAKNDGEPAPVCTAIGEHYLPQRSGDPLPETPAGRWLSLVDKADNLVGGFAAGLQVSGSEDPYGLRRSANGILRLLALEDGVTVTQILRCCSEAYEISGEEFKSLRKRITLFVEERLRSLLSDAGFEYDLIEAVLARDSDDISDVWVRIETVAQFLDSSYAEDLLVAWRRCHNLGCDTYHAGVPKVQSFSAPAAQQLCAEFKEFRTEADRLLDEGDYEGFIIRGSQLREQVDRFLDEVIVMVDDEDTKSRRLNLLSSIADYLSIVADWSQIQG